MLKSSKAGRVSVTDVSVTRLMRGIQVYTELLFALSLMAQGVFVFKSGKPREIKESFNEQRTAKGV